jgi:choline-sulfatase
MTSYFDAQVGRLLDALESIKETDNTYVFVVSDHGEMLGERGSWFKFQPFEGSVRIPMIAAGPGVKQGAREERGVSLLDLLPTFNDLVTEGKAVEPIDPVDGLSLANMMHGNQCERKDDVMMEFLGEGVYAPACILRRDGFKYVYCRHDPAMMFDLIADPHEQVNLAGNALHAETEANLKAEVLKRWDYAALERDVIASQRRRLFAQESLLQGQWTAWDFQPRPDASRQYVRGALDTSTTETKSKKRLPFVAAVKPHHPRDPDAQIDMGPVNGAG